MRTTWVWLRLMKKLTKLTTSWSPYWKTRNTNTDFRPPSRTPLKARKAPPRSLPMETQSNQPWTTSKAARKIANHLDHLKNWWEVEVWMSFTLLTLAEWTLVASDKRYGYTRITIHWTYVHRFLPAFKVAAYSGGSQESFKDLDCHKGTWRGFWGNLVR